MLPHTANTKAIVMLFTREIRSTSSFLSTSARLHRLVRSFLRLLSTGAPEQDDAQQERHDEWDRRDSDNKTGTGVPWRRSPVRILETSGHEEQQRDEGHDDECA